MKNTLAPFYSNEYLKPQPFSLMKKVALIVEKSINFSPCAYIRIILPCIEKYRYEQVVVKCINVDELEYFSPDLIITHRTAVGQDKLLFFLDYVEKKNIPYSYDLDDDLLSIGDSDHPEANYYKNYRKVISQLIIHANKVTVSTENLKLKLKSFRADILVVKNRLYSEIWSHNLNEPKNKIGRFNILYMGTTTHSNDLELINEALRVIKRYHRNIVFNIIGVTDSRKGKGHLNFIEIPLFARQSYPLFVWWLKSLGNFDLGLAPLIDNEFNYSKSGIKFLEYQALGIPVVASKLAPYKDVIQEGVDGLLVENNTRAWVDGILRFYADGN